MHIPALGEVVVARSPKYGKHGPVDEWADAVKDLHRVLNVAQSLFLTLTHHPEGLVRVALELITAKKTKHIFKWHEDWYDDDVRRNWFSREVQERLKYVLAVRDGRPPEGGSDEDSVELRAALARAAEAEAALEALKKENENAERLAGFSEDDAKQHKEAMQRKSDQIASLQERLRQANAAVQTSEDQRKALDEQLQETARRKDEVEASVNQVLSRIRDLEEEASALKTESDKLKQEAAEHEQAAAKAREEASTLRQQLEASRTSQSEMAALQKRIQELTAEAAAHKAQASAAQAKDAEIEAWRASTANAERKASGFEAELQSLQSRYDELATKHAELEAQYSALSESSKELSQRAKVKHGAVQTEPIEFGRSGKNARTLDDEEPTETKCRRSQGDSSSLEEALEKSRRRNAELAAENKRLTLALEELQQKVKDLMAACRAKGVDIDAIAAGIGLDCFNVGSVFDRLFDDARARVERMEKRRQEFYQAHKYDYYKGADIMQELEQSQLVHHYVPPQRMQESTRSSAPAFPSAGKSRILIEQIAEDFSSGGETDEPVDFHPATLAAVLNSRMTKGHHSYSDSQLKSSSAFARKGKLATGVHSHVVAPRGKSRGNKSKMGSSAGFSKMGSSLGFSKATHIITSQTKIANAGDGSLSPRGKSRGNKSKMGSSAGFSKMGSSLGFSKATHIITSQTKIANAGDGSLSPRSKSRGNKNKMGSSLGFSKATHIIASQTQIANASTGNFSNAGRSNHAMRATKSETKLPRQSGGPFGVQQRDRQFPGLGSRLTASASLPSLAKNKFRQTQ